VLCLYVTFVVGSHDLVVCGAHMSSIEDIARQNTSERVNILTRTLQDVEDMVILLNIKYVSTLLKQIYIYTIVLNNNVYVRYMYR